MNPRDVVLGLGSNLGGRLSLLRAGAALLGERLGAAATRCSPVWRTPPVGPPQPDYLNAAVSVRTGMRLDEVLRVALEVETSLGRERRVRWGARTLDVDVLWHDGPPCDAVGLHVPHPALAERPFALGPLLSLCPEARLGGASASGLPSATVPPGELVASDLGAPFETRVLSHTADEGFEVLALDRADLLAAAAEALGAVIVDPGTVRPRATRHVSVQLASEDDDETRLVAFLSECLNLFDGERFAPHRVAVLRDHDEVRAAVVGEAINEARHGVRTAVKAVTWHELEVRDEGAGLRARVILDL